MGCVHCTLGSTRYSTLSMAPKVSFLDIAGLGCPSSTSSTYLHPLPGHFWFCFFSFHPSPLLAYSFLTFSLHPLSHSLQPPLIHPPSLPSFPCPPFPPHLSPSLLPHSSLSLSSLPSFFTLVSVANCTKAENDTSPD